MRTPRGQHYKSTGKKVQSARAPIAVGSAKRLAKQAVGSETRVSKETAEALSLDAKFFVKKVGTDLAAMTAVGANKTLTLDRLVQMFPAKRQLLVSSASGNNSKTISRSACVRIFKKASNDAPISEEAKNALQALTADHLSSLALKAKEVSKASSSKGGKTVLGRHAAAAGKISC